MLVDSLTLSVYFIKLFGIHGNIFTCRYIKFKNGHVKMPATTGINGVPGGWYCFKNKTAKNTK
jgi:hypothetical protein